MVVSRAVTPPTIDGKMEPGEWDRAPACTAWVHPFRDRLGPRPERGVDHLRRQIHLRVHQEQPRPQGKFLSKRARKNDDPGIVFDPSNEIWLTPPVTPATTYQTLFNPYPAVFDAKMIPSVGYTAMSWQGNWKMASSETKDYWIVEARAEIKSFGFDAIKDGSTWRGLFCADLGDGYGFRAWAPGSAFCDIPRHGYLRFKDASPVFQFLSVESIFTGKYNFDMAVTGPPKGQVGREGAVAIRPRRNGRRGRPDWRRRKCPVADGKRKRVRDVRRRDFPAASPCGRWRSTASRRKCRPAAAR